MTVNHHNRRWKLNHAMSNFRHNFLFLRRLGLEKKFSMMVSIAVTRMAVWSGLNVKLSVQKENCCRSGCFTRHLVSSMSDFWLARRTLCGGEYGTY